MPMQKKCKQRSRKVSMNEDLTGILILHYKKTLLTLGCIESIINNETNNKIFKIFVIDNSDQQSFKLPDKRIFDGVKVLRAGKNTGYAGGMNYGIKIILKKKSFSSIFLLNNDVVTGKDCVL